MIEKTISENRVYQGRILDVDVLDVEGPGGRHAVREIVRHGAAVALIARRRDGRFVFIRQFRKAVERICFEVIAGNVDPGETPEAAAARELREESGYVAETLRFMGSIHPSVGYCTERIDIFYADVHEPGPTDFDRDEQIETLLLPAEQMEQKIRSGEVQDAKTLAAWLLFRLEAGSA